MQSECDQMSAERPTMDQLLADGTGFKRRFIAGTGQTNRGELCVLLGVTPQGTTIPVGAWSGKSWSQIEAELKSSPQEQWPRADVLVSDGEPGLAESLSSFVNGQ